MSIWGESGGGNKDRTEEGCSQSRVIRIGN